MDHYGSSFVCKTKQTLTTYMSSFFSSFYKIPKNLQAYYHKTYVLMLYSCEKNVYQAQIKVFVQLFEPEIEVRHVPMMSRIPMKNIFYKLSFYILNYM